MALLPIPKPSISKLDVQLRPRCSRGALGVLLALLALPSARGHTGIAGRRAWMKADAELGPATAAAGERRRGAASLAQSTELQPASAITVKGRTPRGCHNSGSGAGGILLSCRGMTTGVGNVSSFSVPLKNLPLDGVQVNVNFTVGALVDSAGALCTSECKTRLSPRLQVSVGFGSTETPCAGPSGEAHADTNTTVAASLICFPAGKSSGLTVSVLTNQGMDYNVNVWMERYKSSGGSLQTQYGGKKGAATMMALTLGDEDPSVLERIALRVVSRGDYSGYSSSIPNRNRFMGPERVRYLNHLVQDFINGSREPDVPPETSAFFFHESSECISGLMARGGCANPDEVASCFSGARTGQSQDLLPRLAHHVNFLDSAELTLSSGSVPPRRSGRWFVLLTCASHSWTNHSIGEAGAGCPETSVSIEWTSEFGTGWKLWRGFLLMFFAPSVLLLGASFSYLMLMLLVSRVLDGHDWGRQLPPLALSHCSGLCELVWRRVKGMILRPEPRFAALIVLMVSVFCTTALQFVVTYWAMSLRTADRNTCYYNYECYYPFWGLDLPVNNMISHVAYFLAGLHILLTSLTAEFRCGLLAEEGVRPLDLSVFYALAVAVMCEGIGSMSYHLCPSVSTFQFDTAFMLPIAHLSMCALEEWRWEERGPEGGTGSSEPTKKQGSDISAPFKYFLYIICPIWFFNFVGTWYDVDIASKWGNYCVLVGLVALWTFSALGVIRRFLGVDFTSLVGMCGQALLQAYFALGLAALLVLDVVRDYLGGMANIFLLMSAVAMFVVVLFQWITKDLVHSVEGLRCGANFGASGLVRLMLESLPMAAFVAAAVIALQFFQHKTALVSPTASPALSRESNEKCIFASVFDTHDVWHFLSAIALAFWVVALLDIKVRVHLRNSRLTEPAPEAEARSGPPKSLPW